VEEPFVGLLGTRLHWLFDKARMLSIAGSGAPRAASYLTLVASGARDLIELDAERLIRIALEDLREVFPRAAGARLVHASVVKEREATTSPAVGWDALRPGTRTEVPSLLLAGDWIATGLPATIESAALSGHRAADAVLSAP
jgi:zeta-carotene desaturase